MSNKILKFSAAWCQPCKAMSATLSRMTILMDIDSIDIDDQYEIASKYAIRGVPTLVMVDGAGVEVSRLVGSETEAEIKNWVAA